MPFFLQATSSSSGDADFVLGGVVSNRTTNSAAVANSVAETAFDNAYSFSPNTLQAGNQIQVVSGGVWDQSGGAPRQYTIRLTVGGQTAYTEVVALEPDQDGNWYMTGTFNVRSIGAAGSVVGGVAFGASVESGTAIPNDTSTSDLTVDTTAAVAIEVTWEWGAADVSNTATETTNSVVLVSP